MLDIHGQHEQYTLISPAIQMRLLDSCAGSGQELSELKTLYGELLVCRRTIAELEKSAADRERELELLAFAMDEISRADLKPGEEEELDNRIRILNSHDKLSHFVEDASSLLSGSGSAVQALKQARVQMEQGAHIDQSLEELSKRLDESYFEVEDIAQSLREYLARDTYDPDELERCQDRLFLIRRLKKKYGQTVEAVIAYGEEAKKNYDRLSDFSANKAALLKKEADLDSRVLSIARKVSKARKNAAQSLEKEIEAILKELGMPKAVFHISVEDSELSSTGIDTINFLISPNKGEPLRPISSAVSGGELSRIMLAVKSAFASSDPVDTILFDEIDSGIGGEVAVQLGHYLSKLSDKKQVLCITHLATIAVNADNHILVSKRVEGERTYTQAAQIYGEERISEIARMLSGKRDAISLEHAQSLLAKKIKS